MAEKLDPEEIVCLEEVMLAQIIKQDALINTHENKGILDKEITTEFRKNIYGSEFLFDTKVNEYLNTIHTNAKELRYKDGKIARAKPDEVEKISEEKDKIFDWFVDQMQEAQKMFSKYLKITAS